MITLYDKVIDLQVARIERNGSDVVALAPPNRLKIQTTGPGAATLFDEVVPRGKVWNARVSVNIVETIG